MDAAIATLLQIQDKDTRIAHLQKQIDTVPVEKARIEREINQAEELSAAAKNDVIEVEKAIKQTEMDIATVNQRKLDLLGKSHQIKKNDEYKAMLHEVAMFEAQVSKLEDRQLEQMEKLDAAKSRRADAMKLVEAAKTRLQGTVQDLDVRAKNCDEQILKVKAERDTLAKEVSQDLMRLYTRLMKKGGGFRPAVAPLVDDQCSGCNLKVVPQIRHKVLKNDIVCCENCGIILYNPAE